MDEKMQDIVFNMMCDLKKKEIDPLFKASLIQEFMDSKGLTGRQMSKYMGVPKSTLQDWLRWNRISQEQYDTYIKDGYTETDIYRSLRGGSLAVNTKAIDSALENCISKLEVFKLRPPYSGDTKVLLDKLKHILNVIERQIK